MEGEGEVKPWIEEEVRCFCMQGRDEEVSGHCTVPVRCYCEGWYQAQIKMDERMMIDIYDNIVIRKVTLFFFESIQVTPPPL